jgi:hypothetical protein
MVSNKSLDEVNLIAALLHDVQTSHGVVFDKRALRNTLKKVSDRTRLEGLSFLTKTLPRLGKALDKALSGIHNLNAASVGFDSLPDSELPRFLGEFFKLVFHPDGTVLPTPCADSVRVLRQILYLFYKYELPFSDEQEQKVLNSFVKTEQELSEHASYLQGLSLRVTEHTKKYSNRVEPEYTDVSVVRDARKLLSNLFAFFDPKDILPRHGPGSVSTKEMLWDKYRWTNISPRIASVYPIDEYYFSSLSHVCDRLPMIQSLGSKESSAKVILVPKDSRGPRLISCEPVDFQWIQQGLSQAIVRLVEHHPLTKWNVFFTDQGPNQRGALLGSITGKYSTLDLNEASDRVSLDLVRLLFPEHVYTYLENCRSLSTVLPCGRVLQLQKFAPMGSALCFPVLALTVWAILTAGCTDADTRESILVYGDDVIVPTASAVNAMKLLESFGLKINRDKSCTKGFFRESCGKDAFKGVDVTPVRIRTVWSTSPSPESYASWISYANSLYDRKYYACYNYIVEELLRVYGPIPSDDMNLSCPCLRYVPDQHRPRKSRINARLQKREFYVRILKAPVIHKYIDGWLMLLRYFTEARRGDPFDVSRDWGRKSSSYEEISPFSVSSYTKRRSSMLVRRWR